MILRSFTTVLFSVILLYNVHCQETKRNILTNSVSKEKLAKILIDQENFHPLPGMGNPVWLSLDEKTRNNLIEKGEEYLNYEWPSLIAIRYMDFDINGNLTVITDRYGNTMSFEYDPAGKLPLYGPSEFFAPSFCNAFALMLQTAIMNSRSQTCIADQILGMLETGDITNSRENGHRKDYP